MIVIVVLALTISSRESRANLKLFGIEVLLSLERDSLIENSIHRGINYQRALSLVTEEREQ
jgi:hypothetical protein